MTDNLKGKNYRDAGEVDHGMVIDFLEKKGYEVSEIKQIWRHVHAKIKKDNQIFFFKLASTLDIGERTENEVSWNNQMQDILAENKIDYFKVPKVFETGNIGEHFYYIGEYFEGKMLATKKPADLTGLEDWLGKIAKANIFISSIEKIKLPRDRDMPPVVERWDDYFKRIKGWYDTADNLTLEPILKKAEELKTTYHKGLCHGDFIPWHMIGRGDHFILIDAEHATTLWPRYYDVAYFYHRIYTATDSPEMANEYLKKVKELLPADRLTTFEAEFMPILATRILGGFFELKIGEGDYSDKYHEILKENFIKGELY